MSQCLVLTAIGADRIGIVCELTKLASECGCNIVDSRMAIYGDEFTLIMLLEGSANAITQIENRCPPVAVKLDLLTMMKRTSSHIQQETTEKWLIELKGEDSPGVLKEVTEFLANAKVRLSYLKAGSTTNTDEMQTYLKINLTENIDIESLKQDFYQLCDKLGVSGQITATKTTNNQETL